MWEYISQKTLQTRFISILLLVGILPILLIGLLGYMTSKSTIVRQAGVIGLQSLQQINNTLEERLHTITVLSGSLLREEQIISILSDDGDELLRYARDWDIFMNIWNKHTLHSFLNPPMITIYGTNGKVFSSWSSDGSNLKHYLDGHPVFRNLLNRSDDDAVYWTFPHDNFTFQNRSSLISYVTTYVDYSSGNVLGRLILSIEVQDLFQSFSANHGNYYVMSDKGEVLFASNSSPSDLRPYKNYVADRENGFLPVNWNEKKAILVYDGLKTGWKVLQIIPYDDWVGELNQIRNILLIVTFVLAFSSILIGQGLTRKIVLPIKQLVGMMRKVGHGDWSVSYRGKADYELDQLINAFNRMTSELKEMNRRIEKEQKLKAELEFKVLLAQIHPHFIKNTLAAINGLVLNGEVAKIPSLIHSLGFVMSSKIYRSRKAVSFQEELEYLDHYLNVMRIRYSDKFEVFIEVPEPLLVQEIVRFSLQPIVENSIYHGMMPDRPLRIWIHAFYQGDDCLISVIDDGCGTNFHPLEDHGESKPDGDETDMNLFGFSGIGLSNIEQRIKLYYGDRYGILFQSQIGSGTRVDMMLPKKFYKEDHHDSSSSGG